MSRRADHHVLQGRAAGFVTRLLAYFVDVAVLAGIIGLFGWLAILVDDLIARMGLDPRFGLAAVYVFTVPFIIGSYYVFFWTLTGRTIGKWFMGLKIVAVDGEPPTFRRALLRLLGYGLSALAFWVGYLWVIIDDERQAWHDHIATTWVVYDYEDSRDRDVYGSFQQRAER